MDLEEYAQAFNDVECDFEESVERFGLAFEPSETEPRSQRMDCAASAGCHCENGGGSLWRNWISPACIACRTGEKTATFFIDLRCTRHCFFCFNPNQQDYQHFLTHERDIAAELRDAHAHGAEFDCLAITGGEPMLHEGRVLDFLKTAAELYPRAHVRLYTSGDLLDASGLRRLAGAGLDEIRFSVKPEDMADPQAQVYELIEQAVGTVPAVMVEVPVIPGSQKAMEEMLVRLDRLGVRGVNLLELCFPLCNAEAFRQRGLKLRKRPYNCLYDYWYGGGVPIAGSESEALGLLRFAYEQGLAIGLHYCSSDNKNTGQVYQQNKAFDASARPWLVQDPGDRFLKCQKAFEGDVSRVEEVCRRLGAPYHIDPDVPSIAFPLDVECPGVQTGVSVNVFEEDGRLREVALEKNVGQTSSASNSSLGTSVRK